MKLISYPFCNKIESLEIIYNENKMLLIILNGTEVNSFISNEIMQTCIFKKFITHYAQQQFQDYKLSLKNRSQQELFFFVWESHPRTLG